MALTSDELQALCKQPQEVPRCQTSAIVIALKDSSTRIYALRLLRNCSALNPTVKEELVSRHLDEVLSAVESNLERSIDCEDEDDLAVVRCTLQLVSNFANCQATVLQRVAKEMLPLLVVCLQNTDVKVKNYSASVVLLLAKDGYDACAQVDVVSSLCSAMRSDDKCEFALFALQSIAKECDITTAFKSLPQEDRLTVIDVLTSKLDVFHDNESLVGFLLTYYRHQASQILTTLKNNSVQLDPAEFTRLLGLFCELSSHDDLRAGCQGDKSLLIDTVYLLRMIHDVGKASSSEGNMFTPARKLSQQQDEDVASSPAHGFKRDLVRLIGNLCWKHPDNQDEVRELQGLPLLMDCTAIDGKNPLLTEWVVFTLRNLCEGNAANQAVVRGVDDKGLVSVELAKEYGVEKAVDKMNNK